MRFLNLKIPILLYNIAERMPDQLSRLYVLVHTIMILVMKVRLEIERGTATREEEHTKPVWSGEAYLGYQKMVMSSLPPETKILTKRGTGVIRSSDYVMPIPKLPMHGIVISTSRGTSTRIL